MHLLRDNELYAITKEEIINEVNENTKNQIWKLEEKLTLKKNPTSTGNNSEKTDAENDEEIETIEATTEESPTRNTYVNEHVAI